VTGPLGFGHVTSDIGSLDMTRPWALWPCSSCRRQHQPCASRFR